MVGFLGLSLIVFIGERLTGVVGTAGYLILQTGILLAGKFRFEELFKNCPEGAARERHLQEVALKNEELTEKKARLEQNKKTQQEIVVRQANTAAELQRALSDLAKEQGEQVRAAFTQQAVARAAHDRQKRVLAEEEARALQTSLGQLEQESREIQGAIRTFTAKREDMLRNALEHSRNTTLNHLLSTHPVDGADLTGIGSRLKLNLQYAGIRTAADVAFGKVRVVDDFGHVRTSKVVAWRNDLAARYESRLPTRLQGSDLKPIDDYIRSKTTDLENQNRVIQQKMVTAKSNVTRIYDSRRSQLTVGETKIQTDHKNVVAGINAQHSSNVTATQTRFTHLRQNLEREAASVRSTINNLEMETQRLQSWIREVGTPRTKAYESVNLANFARKVFLEKFTS